MSPSKRLYFPKFCSNKTGWNLHEEAWPMIDLTRREANLVQFPDGSRHGERSLRRLKHAANQITESGMFKSGFSTAILNRIPESQKRVLLACIGVASGREEIDTEHWILLFIVARSHAQKRDPARMIDAIITERTIINHIIPDRIFRQSIRD